MTNQHSNLPTLTGQVFGKWAVGAEIKTPSCTSYSCTCKCGSVQEVRRSRLVKGNSTQCFGCRSVKQVCSRGHDVTTCGRNIRGVCRLCVKAGNLSRYGITVEEYEELFRFQGGKCAICGRKLDLVKLPDPTHKNGRAEVDHKHYLKKDAKKIDKKSTVRGLLCGGRWAGCNHKLGKVDNVEWLLKAAEYVSNPPAQVLFSRKVK